MRFPYIKLHYPSLPAFQLFAVHCLQPKDILQSTGVTHTRGSLADDMEKGAPF